jgi:hypothetical protein
MCILIFQWWDSNELREGLTDFMNCSNRLNLIPNAEQYHVAPTALALYTNQMKFTLAESKKKAGPSEESVVKLAGSTITLANRRRKSGLNLNMVIGREIHHKIC